MSVVEEILSRLNAMGVAYDLCEHPVVHTIEDCKWAEERLNARVPKNLFLAPRNLSAHYLCVIRGDACFHTADISKQIGSSRLSFGPEKDMRALLRTFPGAISPMGLMFPEAAPVQLLVDERLKDIPRLAFHPNDNTKTLAMSGRDFFGAFLPATGHEPRYVIL